MHAHIAHRPEAKVAYLEHHVLLSARLATNHEHILRLQVSVYHPLSMQVLYPVEHLLSCVYVKCVHGVNR